VQQHYRVSSGKALTFLEASRLIMARPKGVMEFYVSSNEMKWMRTSRDPESLTWCSPLKAGLGVAVVGSMPSVGLYFGVYSYCKRVLKPFLDNQLGPSSRYHLNQRLVFSLTVTSSAAIGNTIASFSRVPYEVVKQKLQTGVYTGTWEALTHMAAHGGLRAFFPLGGVGIQMLRDIPYAMVTLLCYEALKESFAPLKERYGRDKLVDAMTGALAGGVGSYVTNPMDVIKTRLQTDPALYQGSIGACAMATWQEGGGMAFLRGSVPRLLHKIPANGCFFLFYEFFRTVLKVEQPTTNEGEKVNMTTKRQA